MILKKNDRSGRSFEFMLNFYALIFLAPFVNRGDNQRSEGTQRCCCNRQAAAVHACVGIAGG